MWFGGLALRELKAQEFAEQEAKTAAEVEAKVEEKNRKANIEMFRLKLNALRAYRTGLDAFHDPSAD